MFVCSSFCVYTGKASSSGASISPDVLIPRVRALASDKSVAAVVLRVDSPGGDAFASDLMWREICKLAEKKPVIASMADVAASGGYYISMVTGVFFSNFLSCSCCLRNCLFLFICPGGSVYACATVIRGNQELLKASLL